MQRRRRAGLRNFALAASLSISLSNVKSDTAGRKRSFSFGSRFNSLGWPVPIPPYWLRHGQYVCLVILTARIASLRTRLWYSLLNDLGGRIQGRKITFKTNNTHDSAKKAIGTFK